MKSKVQCCGQKEATESQQRCHYCCCKHKGSNSSVKIRGTVPLTYTHTQWKRLRISTNEVLHISLPSANAGCARTTFKFALWENICVSKDACTSGSFFFNNFISNSQMLFWSMAQFFWGITPWSSMFAFLRIKEKKHDDETYSIYKNITAKWAWDMFNCIYLEMDWKIMKNQCGV